MLSKWYIGTYIFYGHVSDEKGIQSTPTRIAEKSSQQGVKYLLRNDVGITILYLIGHWQVVQ